MFLSFLSCFDGYLIHPHHPYITSLAILLLRRTDIDFSLSHGHGLDSAEDEDDDLPEAGRGQVTSDHCEGVEGGPGAGGGRPGYGGYHRTGLWQRGAAGVLLQHGVIGYYYC